MAIFDILKQELFIESDEAPVDAPIEAEVEGNPKALVDGMIENAPGTKEQIGIILKYAAKSIPDIDVWDHALTYYESLDDGEAPEEAPEEELPLDGEELPLDDELPVDDGEELPLDDEGGDEFPDPDEEEDTGEAPLM